MAAWIYSSISNKLTLGLHGKISAQSVNSESQPKTTKKRALIEAKEIGIEDEAIVPKKKARKPTSEKKLVIETASTSTSSENVLRVVKRPNKKNVNNSREIQ